MAFRNLHPDRRADRRGAKPVRVTALLYLGWTVVLFVLACGMLTIGAFVNGALS